MSSSKFSVLSRFTISEILRSNRRLLFQGAMGLHTSDGLAGKVASARSGLFACVGTVSGVGKTPEMLRSELRRAWREAPGGFVGVNLMAAINHDDFAELARVSMEEGVSFIVQGAGISREIVRWCREAGTPFAGIVSSGRLAASAECRPPRRRSSSARSRRAPPTISRRRPRSRGAWSTRYGMLPELGPLAYETEPFGFLPGLPQPPRSVMAPPAAVPGVAGVRAVNA